MKVTNASELAYAYEEMQRKAAATVPFEIKSTCRLNVSPPHPAVRIIKTGEVIPVTEANAASAKMMVASGLATDITLGAPAPKYGVARVSIYTAPTTNLRSIFFECAACNQRGHYTPAPTPDAIAHCVFWHCGQGQQVPPDIAEAYMELGGSGDVEMQLINSVNRGENL